VIISVNSISTNRTGRYDSHGIAQVRLTPQYHHTVAHTPSPKLSLLRPTFDNAPPRPPAVCFTNLVKVTTTCRIVDVTARCAGAIIKINCIPLIFAQRLTMQHHDVQEHASPIW